MGKAALVIENSQGQVVRTIHWDDSEIVAYLNNDTGRVEVASSVAALEKAEIAFTLIDQVSRTQLQNAPLKLGTRGRIRLIPQIEKTVQLVKLESETPEQLKTISKWTAIGHGALGLLLLLASFFLSEAELPAPQVVTVFRQQELEPKKILKAAEHKIVRQEYKAKVSNRNVKPKNPTPVVAKKSAPVRTQVNLSKVGALGALGGMSNGIKGSAGFNVKATNASLGTGLKSIGKGGVGGLERAIHGQGLVSAQVGTGGFKGSGGYATRGKGGGAPGYGNMSMVGGSSGYFLPLEEEALIEGGLDKDQIAAVIQRHLGEVIYCYEKGLQVQPHLNGRVGIQFVINGGGRVSTASISQSSLKSASVEGCIVNRLRGWNFPKPVGGVNVKVAYPFVLRRVG